MVADIEELEQMDATELHARRLNAKEVRIPSRRWNSQNSWRRSTSENSPERGEEQEFFQGKSDELDSSTQPQDDSTRDGEEAKDDPWTITGEFIYCDHVVPRVKLYVLREETFPIPLKYIDVPRNTHTSLDVMLEKILKITGTWIVKMNCQMHGQASQGERLTRKKILAQTMYG